LFPARYTRYRFVLDLATVSRPRIVYPNVSGCQVHIYPHLNCSPVRGQFPNSSARQCRSGGVSLSVGTARNPVRAIGMTRPRAGALGPAVSTVVHTWSAPPPRWHGASVSLCHCVPVLPYPIAASQLLCFPLQCDIISIAAANAYSHQARTAEPMPAESGSMAKAIAGEA
jgi:hypothetical protein